MLKLPITGLALLLLSASLASTAFADACGDKPSTADAVGETTEAGKAPTAKKAATDDLIANGDARAEKFAKDTGGKIKDAETGRKVASAVKEAPASPETAEQMKRLLDWIKGDAYEENALKEAIKKCSQGG